MTSQCHRIEEKIPLWKNSLDFLGLGCNRIWDFSWTDPSAHMQEILIYSKCWRIWDAPTFYFFFPFFSQIPRNSSSFFFSSSGSSASNVQVINLQPWVPNSPKFLLPGLFSSGAFVFRQLFAAITSLLEALPLQLPNKKYCWWFFHGFLLWIKLLALNEELKQKKKRENVTWDLWFVSCCFGIWFVRSCFGI